MENKKYLTYLGFALKAGKCAVGSYACQSVLKVGKAKVMLCSRLASERTQEKFRTLCGERVPFFLVEEDLSQVTGRAGNLFAVSDEHLAQAIIDNLERYFGGARNT